MKRVQYRRMQKQFRGIIKLKRGDVSELASPQETLWAVGMYIKTFLVGFTHIFLPSVSLEALHSSLCSLVEDLFGFGTNVTKTEP